MAAGLDREFAAHHGLPEAQTCDRCQEHGARGRVLVAGSRAGIWGDT